MNINTIRGNLQTQIQSVYQSGLNVKDTAGIVRLEVNTLLDELTVLEKTLPAINGDQAYTDTTRRLYEEMITHWLSNTDDIYKIIETVKQCRFGQLTTPLQMWTRLRELALEIDKHATFTKKEQFLKAVGIQRKVWLKKVEGIHPDILESYRQANQIKLELKVSG